MQQPEAKVSYNITMDKSDNSLFSGYSSQDVSTVLAKLSGDQQISTVFKNHSRPAADEQLVQPSPVVSDTTRQDNQCQRLLFQQLEYLRGRA